MTHEEVVKSYGEQARERFGDFWNSRAHGGESGTDLWGRVRLAWEDLLQGYAGGRVLVVTHGTPIRLLLCSLTGVPFEQHWKFRIDLGGRNGPRRLPYSYNPAHLERSSAAERGSRDDPEEDDFSNTGPRPGGDGGRRDPPEPPDQTGRRPRAAGRAERPAGGHHRRGAALLHGPDARRGPPRATASRKKASAPIRPR